MPTKYELWLATLTLTVACSSRSVTQDCDGMCEPAGPAFPGVGECVEGVCTPTYGECADKSEVSTCAEVCEAEGSVCVTNGCGGHTYRIYTILEWCEDPDRIGVEIAHDCNEPVDWQVNAAVKCCCEQRD
ncbi:hypothetical protein ENSA5_35920 [Enhygromyxa salina]|uniref:Uncharacterized protein n=1 Tax=Enhygromyxa salina TaxID=215803 RepID=A0A2S9XUH5_9BACT|nr:hypothetical protein ENSA5_35920 [Enhygromyxa salina]